MVAVIERWEWHITAAGSDVAPDVSEEDDEMADFIVDDAVEDEEID